MATPVRLPDPQRSYAVLIGNAAYASAGLPGLPAVAGNLTGLATVLTDPALGALPADRCVVTADPASAQAARGTLRAYAARAEDTLLVYWAGHGRRGPRDELLLSVAGAGEPEASALALSDIRDAVAGSPAANRILILDCCVSERAAPVSGVTDAVPGQAAIEGGCTLISTSPSLVYFSPPGGKYTALTGTLIGIMRDGMPDGPEFLTFAAIYGQLLYAMASRGLSLPRQFGTETASGLALARNPAYRGRQDPDALPDPGPRPSQRASRWRRLAAAVAVVAALGLSITLANISQHQARPAQNAGGSQPGATDIDQSGLSFPVSFSVNISPAAVQDATTRSSAIGHIMSSLDHQLVAHHLQGRRVGLVQVFVSGPITGIPQSNSVARLVLGGLRRRDPIFSQAAGQGFWNGTGDNFLFQIYFFT
jgi:Caspase domain